MNYLELETILGHQFSNKELLKEALTHPSVHVDAGKTSFDYERLEFLGDSVLSLIITELLLKKFIHIPEGDLAQRRAYLIKGESLVKIANNLNLNQYIIMSPGEESAGGRDNASTLENVVESIIGALYLDGGFQKCQKFVTKEWQDLVSEVNVTPIESKTFVQEWAQEKHLPCPKYELIEKSGSDHKPFFKSKITIEGFPPHIGSGSSRKSSEKDAAKEFICKVIKEHD